MLTLLSIKWNSAFLANRIQICNKVYYFVYMTHEHNMPLTTQHKILALCDKNSTLLINILSYAYNLI